MRLNAYLARAGIASRRGAEELIRAGRVRVNGEPAGLATFVAAGDRVELDGRLVTPQALAYVLLHKPPGVVTTARDPHGRPTVVGLVGHPLRVVPVGRLDADTTGALLLTNDGPLVLKGVMCAEDAVRAVELGCDGVVVSNHGGRQLDGLPATVDVLPEVVDAVGGRADVLLDGGLRRGTDVVKALALGARACLIGRPWLFGLATGGEAGVARVLETFREEIDRTLALVGVTEAAALDRSVLRRRPGSGWERLDTRP